MTEIIENLDAQKLIADFGKSIGIDTLSFDAFGCCMLAFDDDVVVNIAFERANQRLLFFGYVGSVDAAMKPYRTLLKSNFYWRATGGSTLSLDQDDGAICLTKPFAISEMDAQKMTEELEVFVANIEKWRDWTKEGADFQELIPQEKEPIGSFV